MALALSKKNFFETGVIEYQSGALGWE